MKKLLILTLLISTPLLAEESYVNTKRLTEDQIKNIISDLGESPICGEIGEIMVNGFRKLGFHEKDFTMESLSSYAAQTIQNAYEIARAVAQEKCGCYDILPCFIPLQICLMTKGQVEEIMVRHILEKERIDSKSLSAR